MALKEIDTENYRVFQVLDKLVPALFDRGQWWFHADEVMTVLEFGDNTTSNALIRYAGEGQAGFLPALIRGSRTWVSEQGLLNYCSKRVSRKRKATIGVLLSLVEEASRKLPPIRLALIFEEGLIQGIKHEAAAQVVVAIVDYDTKLTPKRALKVGPQCDRLCKLGLAHAAHEPAYVEEAFDRLDAKRPESPTAPAESDRNAEPTTGAPDASDSDESDKAVAESGESQAESGKPFLERLKASDAASEAESDNAAAESGESQAESEGLFGGCAGRDSGPDYNRDALECNLLMEQAKKAGFRQAHDNFCDVVRGVLTVLVETDPQAAQAALLSFVRCNPALATNPHVGAYQFPGGSTGTTAMAILNSILMRAGLPAIAPMFTDGVLTGFILASTPPAKPAPPPDVSCTDADGGLVGGRSAGGPGA